MKKQSQSPKKQPMTGPVDAPYILELAQKAHKPLKLDDFLRILHCGRREKKTLEALLLQLVHEGALLRLPGGAYCRADSLKQLRGTMQMQRSGAAFVILDDGQGKDVFIAPHDTGEAWNGDAVLVTLLPKSGGKNPEGRVTQVLERRTTQLAVRVLRVLRDGHCLCQAVDARIHGDFSVECASLPDLVDLPDLPGLPNLADRVHEGVLLQVEPLEQVGPGLWTAKPLRILGDEEQVSVQEQLVKGIHGIPLAFPPAVLTAAARMAADPDEKDMRGRKDLRHMAFVTIDGETAKDFDDAVYVERQGKDFCLWVAIADVAHYVRPGTALDTEAFTRGNSYYFPTSVEPMLPEALSNGLCSLNPHVPRLVMVAQMRFSADAAAKEALFYPAVIESKARLTYTRVYEGIVEGHAEARAALGDTVPMLDDALALARSLAAMRSERGSLDFDLPEPAFSFAADGSVSAVSASRSTFANRLIEEFMVAANEAVARYLTHKKAPCMYRVHPAPDTDKLQNLLTVLGRTNLVQTQKVSVKNGVSPRLLQQIIAAAKGSEQEYLINRMALRSMMQACYSPEPEEHFGLASACYGHFTSPIRRYADLVVHRSLKAALATDDAADVPDAAGMQAIADHINTTERHALDAEREITRRLGCLFMLGHVGETFSGVISGLTDFGIFVELKNPMVEGMVRLASLTDDYYIFAPELQELRGERTGRLFSLGQTVEVLVRDVSVTRQEITMELTESNSGRPGHAGASRRPRGAGLTLRGARTGRGGTHTSADNKSRSTTADKKTRSATDPKKSTGKKTKKSGTVRRKTR